MLGRTLRSAPLALVLLALVLAGPAAAGGHKWKHHGHGHGHHHDRACGHDAYYYAPRYVEHWHYREPVVHYVPAPQPYYCGSCGHPVAVLAVPSVIFQASIGGGWGWDIDD